MRLVIVYDIDYAYYFFAANTKFSVGLLDRKS